MEKKSQKTREAVESRLVEPQQALRVYLDALLCEVAFSDNEESANAPLPIVVAEPPPTDVVVVESVAEATVSNESVVEVEESTVVTQQDWTRSAFQCLSFQVADVTLAAPLEKLSGILEVDEEPTELPGYAPWVVGLLPNRGQNVQIIDIAQIIMPEGHSAPVKTARERLHYIILVGNGRFGLVADALSGVLNLEPDDVRWRGEHSKRPWLAGTAVERMCAVLDVDNLCEQLLRGLKLP
ncbi:MAG: chemotaxis protein CheW [Gammaproteobacteria bacterium]|nr:chemotaxis protein CheW [Gammaproteobacteria bacterium]